MPNIPLNFNIPQIDQKLSDSQDDLLNNFGAINDFLDINHFTFNDIDGNDGKHKYIQMILQPLNIHLIANTGSFFPGQYKNVPENNLQLAYISNYPGNITAPITAGFPFHDDAEHLLGFFWIGQSIIVRWGYVNLPLRVSEAGILQINYLPDNRFPPFRAGSSPLIFLSYYLNPVSGFDPSQLIMSTNGVSTPTGFQIYKLA